MRYIPSSRYTLDEIANQCRAAINPANTVKNSQPDLYNEVRKFYHYSNPLLVAR